jgi:hypothetical protein
MRGFGVDSGGPSDILNSSAASTPARITHTAVTVLGSPAGASGIGRTYQHTASR